MYDMIRVHCGNLITVNVKCLHVLYVGTLLLSMWSVFMSYITLMVPRTLYGIGILWSPFTLHGTGNIWSTLIWNRYCMFPPHVRMVHPTCTIWFFFRPACPKEYGNITINSYGNSILFQMLSLMDEMLRNKWAFHSIQTVISEELGYAH